jgi:hypothetical protein
MVGLLKGTIAAVLGVVGVGVLGVGGLKLRTWWAMRNMDPTAGTGTKDGLQELEGRARSLGETVTSPFSKTESLVCEYHVKRFDQTDEETGEVETPTGEGGNWNSITHGTEAVPFEVEHAGGTTAVDPENAQQVLSNDFQTETRGGDGAPPGVQEYIEDGKTAELGPVELNSRGGLLRFTENRLHDGDEVYVLGPAERAPSAVPDGSDARTAIAPGERGWTERLLGDPFIVADGGEEAAESRQLTRSLLLVGIGVVTLGFASALLLFPSAFG